jgi:hypothetical protein
MRRPSLALLLLLVLAAAVGCGSGGNSTTSGEGAGNGGAGSSAEAGGEESIEQFGSEATGSERAALRNAFHGYLAAIGERDYGTACSYLAAAARRSLAKLFAEGASTAGCAASLAALVTPAAAGISRKQSEADLTAIRVEGNRGFVLFPAPGASLWQMTMEREDGDWKTTTVAASILVPSAATLGQ